MKQSLNDSYSEITIEFADENLPSGIKSGLAVFNRFAIGMRGSNLIMRGPQKGNVQSARGSHARLWPDAGHRDASPIINIEYHPAHYISPRLTNSTSFFINNGSIAKKFPKIIFNIITIYMKFSFY